MQAISLTKLLEDRYFRDELDEHIVYPVKRANAILQTPATPNAGIDFGAVGVAYDYCLRCAIHRMSGTDLKAIQSFPAFKYYYLRYHGISRVRKQMDLHLRFLQKYLDCSLANADDLFRACLFLAKFDAEYKSGMPIEQFSVLPKNVTELARIVAGSNVWWLAGKLSIVGPIFDCSGNDVAIKADGDLIVDNTLIDLKTSSRLALKDSFRQLVGYYALNKIAGDHFQIDGLGLYYPRFQYFIEFPIRNVVHEEKVESLLSLFTRALGKNIKRDESRSYDVVDGAIQNEVALTDEKGLTLLHHAAFKGDREWIASLIKKGANPNARDNEGHPPLFHAILKQYTDIAETLIKAGADVNLADNEGWTPLHVAVFEKQIDTIQLLIEHGADTKIRDREGLTPLSIASKKQKKEIRELLNAKDCA